MARISERYEVVPGNAKVEALISEMRKEVGEFQKWNNLTTIKHLKKEIPAELPSELKSILRRGIYRVCEASSQKQALESVEMMEKRYYIAKTITECKINAYNSSVES